MGAITRFSSIACNLGSWRINIESLHMGKLNIPLIFSISLAMIMAGEVRALGLGEANLDSKLGQPLFARIPIFNADGVGSESLRVVLQSVMDEGTGVEVASIDSRAISVVGEVADDGGGTIFLRSDSPINEPFLHFLLKVRWPGGELSRTYTFLLDLPEKVIETPVVTAAPSELANEGSVSSALATSRQRVVDYPAAGQTITADTLFYSSVRGDSLWSIAKRVARAKGGTPATWMERIYQNNPTAFIRNQRNLLKERVTLDLFESIVPVELAVTEASKKPKPVSEQELHSASVDKPGSSLLESQPAIVRREGEEAAASPDEAPTVVLTEKQFLQQNLTEVRMQVAEVSSSIAEMTSKLAALQTQLEVLNREYASLGDEDAMQMPSEVLPAPLTLDTGITAGGEALVIDNDLRSDLNEPTVVNDTEDGVFGVDPLLADANVSDEETAGTTVEISGSGDTRSWLWLWWLLPLTALVLLLLRYRQRESTQYNIDSLGGEDLSDVNAAVAAKAKAERVTSKDHFNDIFTALDSKSVGVRKASGITNDQTYSSAGNKLDVFVEPPVTNTSLADIDDDFFADLDEDALDARGDLHDESEFLGLDIPELDDSWLKSGDSKKGDSIARASACIEMGDYLGARQILENDIVNNDGIELKMQLLDVYAHGGDSEEFEELVLQIEFASPSDEILLEIDVLRDLLQKNSKYLDEDRAD